MKRLVIFGSRLLSVLIVLFIFPCKSSGQYLDRQVIGSGGGTEYRTDSAVVLNFQTGEPVVQTFISGRFALTQGFEQPDSIRILKRVKDISYTFYPNPVTELANLKLVSPTDADLTLRMTDLNGKAFWEKQITLIANQEKIVRLPVQDLATGYYLLYFFGPTGKEIHSVKWLKI